MKFTFEWIMDKLGYMPKFDMKIGKIAEPWSFPTETPKKKPSVAKATTRVKKTTAKSSNKKK